MGASASAELQADPLHHGGGLHGYEIEGNGEENFNGEALERNRAVEGPAEQNPGVCSGVEMEVGSFDVRPEGDGSGQLAATLASFLCSVEPFALKVYRFGRPPPIAAAAKPTGWGSGGERARGKFPKSKVDFRLYSSGKAGASTRYGPRR